MSVRIDPEKGLGWEKAEQWLKWLGRTSGWGRWRAAPVVRLIRFQQ